MKGEEPSAIDLTFPWADRPVSPWRLAPPLLLCIAVLVAMALIFAIKTPPPIRAHHPSQSIVLLDPANPVNQIALNRAQDRSALILGSETIDELIGDTSPLPVFRPSFSGFQLRLKEPDIARTKSDQPRLFQPQDLALPTNPPPAPPNAAPMPIPKKSWRLIPKLHGPLASRPLLSLPEFSSLRPQDLARLRFRMAVNSMGRTVLVIPLHSGIEDREIVPSLQSALASMRFKPTQGESYTWGDVFFTWTSQPSRHHD